MADIIATSRRTLSLLLDETCSRLDVCPEIPIGTVTNPLTGGSVAINGMQRWRKNATGEVIEYTEWKLPADRIKGKSPYAKVWWKE